MGYPEMMRDVMEQIRREEIRKRRQEIENITIIDHVTGLYNRGYFHLRLDEEMLRSKLYGNNLSLIFLDVVISSDEDCKIGNAIDHKTTKAISEIISVCLRDGMNLTFLYDKGKFAIILPEVNKHEANLTAFRIRKMIRKANIKNVNTRTGIVQYDNDEHAEELIKSANDALYEAMKSDGQREN